MLVFPSWDRNRCFHSSLVLLIQNLQGTFEGMAASQCFLWAGCGRLLCLAPEAGPEHLGHPYSLLPTYTHSHHRIKVGGGQMTGLQGSNWDWGKLGAFCQWGSSVLLKIRRAVQPSTANYTDWAGRYLTTNTHTQAQKTLPLPLSLHIPPKTANCALLNSWKRKLT